MLLRNTRSKTSSERQRKFRENTDRERINTYVSKECKDALRLLKRNLKMNATDYCLTESEVIEKLVSLHLENERSRISA